LITFIQIIIVQFTQDVFQVARKGLFWSQWLLCIGVGLTVFPINFVTKFFPNRYFPELGKKKKNKIENHINTEKNDPNFADEEDTDKIIMKKEEEKV